MKAFFKQRYSRLFILMVAAVCIAVTACRTATLESKQAQSLIVNDSLNVDSSMIKLIEPYRSRIDSVMTEVIGYSESVMEKGTPESLLGNFLCDLLVTEVKVQFKDSLSDLPVMALLNNGGLRTSLPRGEITVEDIFRLMPFDNEIVVLELKGSVLRKLFDVIASKGGMPVGGVRLVLNATRWTSAEVGGQSFSDEGSYLLVTSDYLATGGDGLSFLSESTHTFHTGILVRDQFIHSIRAMTAEGKTINPKLDGRINYE